MDIMLAPITTHVNVSDVTVSHTVLLLSKWYLSAAWILPHAMSFMLASIFTHEYKVLSRRLDRMLAESDARRLSDSNIATKT